jgi:hypothetical protein
MKLRSKILLAPISVGVVPLLISLWVIGGMVSDKLDARMDARVQVSANFIEQTSRSAELDHVVETLTRLTSAVEAEVGVFKI